MCGNNKLRNFMLLPLMLCIVAVSVSYAGGKERRLPEKPFRFGIEGEPGLKSVNGEAFQLDYGLVFKIMERISIIPRFGFHYSDYGYRTSPTTTTTRHSTDINGGITVRYEFVRRLTQENTRYEYDVEKQEFKHYYYASALRPFVQTHLGTFTGVGGGISYYVIPQIGIGIGADLGWNWLAQADHNNGFAIIAPKAVVTIAFN
jgi:hypothetical protein